MRLIALNDSLRSSFLRRHAPLVAGIALSIFLHAIAIWFSIWHASIDLQPLPLGSSNPMTIALLPNLKGGSSPKKSSIASESAKQKKVMSEKKEVARPASPLISQAGLVVASTGVPEKHNEIAQSEAGDMLSQLEARRKRREQAQEHDSAAYLDAEARRKNSLVMANIATSLGRANSDNTNGDGGVFQLRFVGATRGSFLFRGWNSVLHRSSTKIVEVVQNGDQDIRIEIVKKMIEIIREHKHNDFVWESIRLGRQISLSARPEYHAQLSQFLMEEFFPDYLPAPR